MIDKEKVRQLAIELYKCSMTPQNNERLITEWLEQNQPEPVVVGLSGEQVGFLSFYLYGTTDDRGWFEEQYKSWRKTQTFAQGDWREMYDRLHIDYNLLLAELKEYRIREMPMLDEQCKFKDQFDNLNMEPEQLKSQSQPNWGDAPENAKWLTISHLWSDENHKQIRTTIMSEHKRPKPAPPLIEEGQTWELLHDEHGMTVDILAVGDMSINGIYSDSVTFMLNRKPRTMQTEAFLSKFAKVP